MFKKILCLLIALSLICSSLTPPAYAARYIKASPIIQKFDWKAAALNIALSYALGSIGKGGNSFKSFMSKGFGTMVLNQQLQGVVINYGVSKGWSADKIGMFSNIGAGLVGAFTSYGGTVKNLSILDKVGVGVLSGVTTHYATKYASKIGLGDTFGSIAGGYIASSVTAGLITSFGGQIKNPNYNPDNSKSGPELYGGKAGQGSFIFGFKNNLSVALPTFQNRAFTAVIEYGMRKYLNTKSPYISAMATMLGEGLTSNSSKVWQNALYTGLTSVLATKLEGSLGDYSMIGAAAIKGLVWGGGSFKDTFGNALAENTRAMLSFGASDSNMFYEQFIALGRQTAIAANMARNPESGLHSYFKDVNFYRTSNILGEAGLHYKPISKFTGNPVYGARAGYMTALDLKTGATTFTKYKDGTQIFKPKEGDAKILLSSDQLKQLDGDSLRRQKLLGQLEKDAGRLGLGGPANILVSQPGQEFVTLAELREPKVAELPPRVNEFDMGNQGIWHPLGRPAGGQIGDDPKLAILPPPMLASATAIGASARYGPGMGGKQELASSSYDAGLQQYVEDPGIARYREENGFSPGHGVAMMNGNTSETPQAPMGNQPLHQGALGDLGLTPGFDLSGQGSGGGLPSQPTPAKTPVGVTARPSGDLKGPEFPPRYTNPITVTVALPGPENPVALTTAKDTYPIADLGGGTYRVLDGIPSGPVPRSDLDSMGVVERESTTTQQQVQTRAYGWGLEPGQSVAKKDREAQTQSITSDLILKSMRGEGFKGVSASDIESVAFGRSWTQVAGDGTRNMYRRARVWTGGDGAERLYAVPMTSTGELNYDSDRTRLVPSSMPSPTPAPTSATSVLNPPASQSGPVTP